MSPHLEPLAALISEPSSLGLGVPDLLPTSFKLRTSNTFEYIRHIQPALWSPGWKLRFETRCQSQKKKARLRRLGSSRRPGHMSSVGVPSFWKICSTHNSSRESPKGLEDGVDLGVAPKERLASKQFLTRCLSMSQIM